ncbi:MAG: hypothetical protein US58_C0012G0008 [Candidatus Magasanikbacteria bacterium GW2011_GWA2_37_8]|uniref:Uncharacterized protein n=1 Tax=Candidatus Magasanikbacteria bacterium GW2011_GWA2_37_8 TaxID=1619036 RepID=A0A0G0JV63_9BACT|nr:MAG: hypothetical protein US58_C0012G0008 [Candidatus Magasanikbacteria bacterium GW2011_GWA2_37_8]
MVEGKKGLEMMRQGVGPRRFTQSQRAAMVEARDSYSVYRAVDQIRSDYANAERGDLERAQELMKEMGVRFGIVIGEDGKVIHPPLEIETNAGMFREIRILSIDYKGRCDWQFVKAKEPKIGHTVIQNLISAMNLRRKEVK